MSNFFWLSILIVAPVLIGAAIAYGRPYWAARNPPGHVYGKDNY